MTVRKKPRTDSILTVKWHFDQIFFFFGGGRTFRLILWKTKKKLHLLAGSKCFGYMGSLRKIANCFDTVKRLFRTVHNRLLIAVYFNSAALSTCVRFQYEIRHHIFYGPEIVRVLFKRTPDYENSTEYTGTAESFESAMFCNTTGAIWTVSIILIITFFKIDEKIP